MPIIIGFNLCIFRKSSLKWQQEGRRYEKYADVCILFNSRLLTIISLTKLCMLLAWDWSSWSRCSTEQSDYDCVIIRLTSPDFGIGLAIFAVIH